jgi:hypothetical protein
MATTPKRPSKLPAKPLSKEPSKRVATPRAKRVAKPSAAASQPFLRFYHSENLRAKTLETLSAVEAAEDTTRHRDALANVIVELSDSGMDYFFMRPLKLAKVGFVTEQSANLGMAGAKTVLGSVVRTIVGRMDKPQLLSVCRYMRELMK